MPTDSSAVARAVLPRLIRDLRPYRRSLIGYCGILVVSALCGVTVPLLTRRLIDHGLRTHSTATVIAYGIALMVVGVLGAAASARATAWGIIVGTRMVLDLRTRLYAHLQTMSFAFYTRVPAGALQSRISVEVYEAQNLVQIVFGAPAANSVTLVAAVIAMATISPLVTAIAVAAALPLLLPVRACGRRVHELARAQAKANRDVTAYLAERLNVGGAMLRLLFGHHEHDLAAVGERMDRAYEATTARNLTFARSAVVLGTFSALGVGVVYLVGGWRATTGSLSIGSVIALAGLVAVVYSPIVNLATSGVNIGGGLIAFERVYELLDFPNAVADPEQPAVLNRPASVVEFRSVSFRHPGPRESAPESLLDEDTGSDDAPARWALRDVSFSTVPGGTTAIVGATGAGKSTLASLVCRLYDPTEGSVLLDGIDLRQLSPIDLHAAIGMVTQDAHLLNETLAANLRIAAPDASQAQLRAVCSQAALDDVLARMPDGLETAMGDRGYRLSGGERQRVALARVLLAGPDVIVLDEATAHLDTETEQAITAALQIGLRAHTRIVIAHRLSTIVHADQILVVDDGQIVEVGTHTSLLQHGDRYRRLHAAGTHHQQF
jgi:ATP-binding cassette subfamily B protein